MPKNIFVLICLFSYSFLFYFPLAEKELDFKTDDLCYYSEEVDKEYVKACDKGYYCYKKKSTSVTIGICLEYKPGFKKYKEKCSQDSECYIGLKCIENLCIVEKDDRPYIYKDKFSGKQYYYCSNDTIPYKSGNDIICKSINQNEELKDKCFHDTEKDIFFSYNYLKICGNFDANNNISSISDFGVLDDNTLVKDVLACKSGFALYFDKNKETFSANSMSQVCITLKGVEKDENSKCIIRYSKGSEIEFIYAQSNVNGSLYNKNNFSDCDVIMIKKELLQDYLTTFQKLKTYCEKEQFYNEPFTCENDELRKLWYYYNNPEDYLLYKNNDEIINYLIENAYPTPISKIREEEDEKGKEDISNALLFNKYFLSLLLLIF